MAGLTRLITTRTPARLAPLSLATDTRRHYSNRMDFGTGIMCTLYLLGAPTAAYGLAEMMGASTTAATATGVLGLGTGLLLAGSNLHATLYEQTEEFIANRSVHEAYILEKLQKLPVGTQVDFIPVCIKHERWELAHQLIDCFDNGSIENEKVTLELVKEIQQAGRAALADILRSKIKGEPRLLPSKSKWMDEMFADEDEHFRKAVEDIIANLFANPKNYNMLPALMKANKFHGAGRVAEFVARGSARLINEHTAGVERSLKADSRALTLFRETLAKSKETEDEPELK